MAGRNVYVGLATVPGNPVNQTVSAVPGIGLADIRSPVVSGGGSGVVTVSSLAALNTAIANSANAGKHIQLTAGSYGQWTTSARPSVMTWVEAQVPGTVTVDGFWPDGAANITFADITTTDNRYNNGCLNVIMEHCYMKSVEFIANGIAQGTGSSSTVPNACIVRGCTLEAPSADSIYWTAGFNCIFEENEVLGVLENGAHCDVFQGFPYWFCDGVIFRRNYIHDNPSAQGFFVKDFVLVNVECTDNLFVRNLDAQIHGSHLFDCHGVNVSRNTCVANEGGDNAFRELGNLNVVYNGNVGRLGSDDTWDSSWIDDSSNNIVTSGSGVTAATLNTRGTGNQSVASPVFVDAATDDYRLAAGQGYPANCGISWRPADFVYGVRA